MAYEWDFNKLPEEEHDNALAFFNSKDAVKLMLLHNKYELSPELYCCSIQNQMIINWFKYGIENGFIKEKSS